MIYESNLKKCLLSACTVVICDQITKELAVSFLLTSVPVIPRFFSFTLLTNTGSICGIGSNYTQLLGYLGIIFDIIFIFFYLKSSFVSHPIMAGILIGGTTGNTLDRFFRSYVIDFLDFYIQSFHWPCFNLADIAITISCLWFVFDNLRKKNKIN